MNDALFGAQITIIRFPWNIIFGPSNQTQIWNHFSICKQSQTQNIGLSGLQIYKTLTSFYNLQWFRFTSFVRKGKKGT